jgi:hypothetical protein
VAAAARNGDSDRAKKEVQDKLTNLLGRCQSPAALEEDIVEVLDEANDLAAAVRVYQRTAPRSSTNAANIMLQDLQDRLEAFSEYVMLRADHRDDEHLMGLVRMAQFVREPIRALIDFFNAV